MKYRPESAASVGRPLERILAHVAELDSALAAPGLAEGLADEKVANGLRTKLFRVQALLRLYSPKIESDKPLEKVKELEDALGELDLRRSLRSNVEGKGFPAPVIHQLEKDEAGALKDLRALLADRWAVEDGEVKSVGKIIKHLLKSDIGGYGDDRRFLTERLAEEIKEIEHGEFDMNELEAGIHEARRQLRWIPLYMQSLGGAVQLSETQNPVPGLKKLLQDPEAQSPFLKLPPPVDEKRPIVISKSLFIANSKLIGQLGKIKDEGQVVEFLAEAYVKAGVESSPKKAHRQVTELLASQLSGQEIHAQSRRLFEDFMASGALRALRRELEG